MRLGSRRGLGLKGLVHIPADAYLDLGEVKKGREGRGGEGQTLKAKILVTAALVLYSEWLLIVLAVQILPKFLSFLTQNFVIWTFRHFFASLLPGC